MKPGESEPTECFRHTNPCAPSMADRYGTYNKGDQNFVAYYFGPKSHPGVFDPTCCPLEFPSSNPPD